MSITEPARKHRPHRRVILIAAVVVVLYLLVLVLYLFSGRIGSGVTVTSPPPGGLTVELVPQSVDAAGEKISMRVEVDTSPELRGSDGVSLSKGVTIVVSPVTGSQTIELARGTIPGTQSIDVMAPGAIENWPFDTYRPENFKVAAFVTSDGITDLLPLNYYIRGYLPGWSISEPTLIDSAVPGGVPTVDVTASRSWSTLAFGILLLGLMVLIAGLVLYVAITVYQGKRKVEAAFMSWIGAMLFATIPLRGFLPGSPPIGSWIDYLIVLWVIVALVTGLGIYVTAWKRWGSPGEAPPVSPPQEQKE